MEIKTEGLILKRIKYSDSKIILHIFTSEIGRIAAIITIGKTQKSKYKRNILLPLQFVKMVLYKSEKRTLYRIKEIKHAFIYKNIMQAYRRSAVGLYLLEFLDKCLKEDSRQLDLYIYFLKAITYLDTAEKIENIHAHTIVNMTKFFGIYPNINKSGGGYFDIQKGSLTHKFSQQTFNETLTNYLKRFLLIEIEESDNIRMSRLQRIGFLEKMEEYWSYHCVHFSKTRSLKVLQEVIP